MWNLMPAMEAGTPGPGPAIRPRIGLDTGPGLPPWR